MQLFYCLPALALLASCAAPEVPSDWELNNGRHRVVVTVIGADNNGVKAFDGMLVSVPGYLFARGVIIMHPGKQRLGLHCPVPSGQATILDNMPSVEYEFEAGGRYELYCNSGWPAIRVGSDRH